MPATTQPPVGVGNRVPAFLAKVRLSTFTCVWWQVTFCGCEVGFP